MSCCDECDVTKLLQGLRADPVVAHGLDVAPVQTLRSIRSLSLRERSAIQRNLNSSGCLGPKSMVVDLDLSLERKDLERRGSPEPTAIRTADSIPIRVPQTSPMVMKSVSSSSSLFALDGGGDPSAIPKLEPYRRLILVPTVPPPEVQTMADPPATIGDPEPRAVKLWQLTGGYWGELGRGQPMDAYGYEIVDYPPEWDVWIPACDFSDFNANGLELDLNMDRDKHYETFTASFTNANANIAGTDIGIPIPFDDYIVFFFGDTTTRCNARGPFFGKDFVPNTYAHLPCNFLAGDSYGWTDVHTNIFMEPPKVHFFHARHGIPWPADTAEENSPFFKFDSTTMRGRLGGGGFLPLTIDFIPKLDGMGFLDPGDPGFYGANHGPTGGFAYDESVYVFYMIETCDPGEFRFGRCEGTIRTDCTTSVRRRTILARTLPSQGGGVAGIPSDHGMPIWQYVCDMPDNIPKVVAPLRVQGKLIGKPELGDVLLLYGTDENYRNSYVYLAYCKLDDLTDVARLNKSGKPYYPDIHYLQHVDYSNGLPGTATWHTDPKLAAPLFSGAPFDPGIGELSVVHDPKLDLYLMTTEVSNFDWQTCYAFGLGYSIPCRNVLLLRWAPTPFGPWGSTYMVNPKTQAFDHIVVDPEPWAVLYDRQYDYGLGNLLHDRADLSRKFKRIPSCWALAAAPDRTYDSKGDDRLGDILVVRGKEGRDEPGGVYGGYIVAPWLRHRKAGGRTVLDVVYTLSTWNPYQSHLMSTSFEVGGTTKPIVSVPDAIPPWAQYASQSIVPIMK